MKPYVAEDSVVRSIWGKSDTILFVFAGAAAEFALNKAVDWLYFTGRLPADPLGRLFSTVMYARRIVFANEEQAHKAIDSITGIHKAVEKSRGTTIPDWAYRDVLFMLIHYSIAAYELLERPMTAREHDDLFDVFFRMGTRMGLKDLPASYTAWLKAREEHLQTNLAVSKYSKDLFQQYRKHLGSFRYWLLCESQKMVIPAHVSVLLGYKHFSAARPLLFVYKQSRRVKLDGFLKGIILPAQYKKEIADLDQPPVVSEGSH